MKKITSKLFILLFVIVGFNVFAQTPCTFAGAECCGEGITNFQLTGGTASINRSSSVNENGGFTTTGVTTTVEKGQTYNYSITFPLEGPAVSCNTYNAKIYIDFNHNGILTDTGEEVVSLSNKANGTHTGIFMIPSSAMTGNAYMRVMMKMAATSLSGGFCGHSAITACNNPPDLIAFHGEVENYTLNITGTSGINELDENLLLLNAFPNPFSGSTVISYTLNDKMPVVLEVYNILGERTDVLVNETQTMGEYKFNFQSKTSANGVYFIKFSAGNKVYTQKLVEVK